MSSREDNQKKRKQPTAVPVVYKINALRELKDGIPVHVIADNLNVTPQTVRKWQKNEKKIENFQNDCDNGLVQGKKRMRKITNQDVDNATWLWFKEQRAAGIPVQGTHVQMQAKIFHAMLGSKNDFVASNGWLYKWQQRHNIRSKKICGEKLSADTSAAERYKVEFKNYVASEGLSLDEVFNCDESPLNFKMLPTSTLSSTSEAGAFGIKGKKERVTVMACSNATGTLKLPLVLIGKSAKPRAIKNLKKLPVYYRGQKSAWMTTKLFEEWFQEEFVPLVSNFLLERGLQKAVLFVDNCAAHSPLTEGKITIRFFPPNTTCLLQPMDQGCLQNLKMNYRSNLMEHVIKSVNNGGSLLESLKSVTMREVMFWISDGWNKITPSTIRKSWNTLWPIDDTPQLTGTSTSIQSSGNETQQLLGLFFEAIRHQYELSSLQQSDVNTWFNSANTLNSTDILSNEEIIDVINGDRSPEDSENLEPDEDCNISIECDDVTKPKITTLEAQQAVETIIRYCDENDCLSGQDITLFNLRELLKSQNSV